MDGKEYRGFVMYSSNPAMLSKFDEMGEGAILYHLLSPVGCLLLLLLVIRTAKSGKKKKPAALR